MRLPDVLTVSKLAGRKRRLYIGAYGFEPRSLAWARQQAESGKGIQTAAIFRYLHPKGNNRIRELRQLLSRVGARKIVEIKCDTRQGAAIEDRVERVLCSLLPSVDEVIVDISAMTKLVILVTLCKLQKFSVAVRLIYSESKHYSPTQEEYEQSKHNMALIATYPSQGFESIVRARCLGSIRMQGQPVAMVAFTSFNEQLVRHMLGTINPHRLLFVNGRTYDRVEYRWRELAVQEIHSRLIAEYESDNPMERGQLARRASVVDYRESVERLDEIYHLFGMHERLICAATGTKMQNVGLFFAKVIHPELHIEYPTPDSYYVRGGRRAPDIGKIHEVFFPNLAAICNHQDAVDVGVPQRALDDWYFVVNRVFFGQNRKKDVFVVFAKLVENIGRLVSAMKRRGPSEDVDKCLAGTFAWWFVLCGKMKIVSVEAMVWAKYPRHCPYCLRAPHAADACQYAKRHDPSPNWGSLTKLSEAYSSSRPRTLREWQLMFSSIYPVEAGEEIRSTAARLTEQLAQLSCALRISVGQPQYFLSEASDLFSWLIRFANLLDAARVLTQGDRARSLERTFVSTYPDTCIVCGEQVCLCPGGGVDPIGHPVPGSLPLGSEGEKASELLGVTPSVIHFGDFEAPVEGGFLEDVVRESGRLQQRLSRIASSAGCGIGKFQMAIGKVRDMASIGHLTQSMADDVVAAAGDLNQEVVVDLQKFLSAHLESPWNKVLLRILERSFHSAN